MRRLPPLGGLQAFVHVSRLGSLKAAADSLALSSPALTRRIQALEQFVGAALFERQHNAVHINPQGQAFLEAIAPHLDALSLAIERATVPARVTRLRVAVPSLFASQRLVPALRSLRELHPLLSIELDTSPNRLGKLGDGIDMAIAITSEVDPRLYSRVIERGRIIAIGCEANRQLLSRPADLEKFPILLHREMPNALREWCASVGLAEFEPANVTMFDSGQLLLDGAAEGLGIAFMLESHLKSSSDPRIVQVFEDSAASPYAYWFACAPAALDRPPVLAFHDWLMDNFADR